VDALAAHLLTLLGDADMRARMGEYGREQVELRFSPDRLASDVLGVYERVLGRC
jgi:glycosyltransferase involved in cell wall biosynthesis